MNYPEKDTAIERLKRLLNYLQQDPDNSNIMSDVFDLALQTGNQELAQEMVSAYLSASPADIEWRNRQAILWIAQRRLKEAELLLVELAERGNMTSGVQFNLAYVAFYSHRFQQCAALCEELLPESDVASQVLTLLIRTLHRSRQYEMAIETVNRYLNTPVMTAETLGVASLIAIDDAQFELASRWSEQTLSQLPTQVEALVARGMVELRERKADSALKDLNLALSLAPQDGRIESAIGTAYMYKTDMQTAKGFLKKAINHMPEHIGTWIALGWCQLFLEEGDNAHTSFLHALELDHNFADSHGVLAVSFALRKNREMTSNHIAKALRLDPKCIPAQYAQVILDGKVTDTKTLKNILNQIDAAF